jgi:serine/threonine protein kinase
MLTCPRGHRWRTSEDATFAADLNPRCPTCGELAVRNGQPSNATVDVTINESGPATLTPERIGQPPPRCIGDFEIIDELGRGGMSVVYKARDLRLRRHAALKFLLAGEFANPEQRRRFMNEAHSLAALQHPNIVQLLFVGEHEGRAYLVLEFVDGPSLARYLLHNVMAPRAAAELLEPIARGVHYAHQRGVLHRDLKPGNILLQESGNRNPELVCQIPDSRSPIPDSRFLIPKVTDFGLARRLDDATMTHTGDVLGTPAYMSPEQGWGKSKVRTIGPATDIYALGALLYEMLTGRPPFRGETPVETLEQVLHQDPIPPRQLQPKTPRDLETICLKCLDKLPSKRYVSADALADDLRRFLENQPIQARRTTLLERALKWVRRHPTRAALFVLIALGLAGLVVGVLIHNALLQREVERAEWNAQQARLEQERADANYQAARETFRKMIARLTSEQFGGLPRLGELQRHQLEDALEFYQKVIADRPDATPAGRLDLANACMETGYVQMFLGRIQESEASVRQALRLYEELQREAPELADYRGLLAHAHNTLGSIVADRGEDEAALEEHRRGITLWQEVVDSQPDNLQARRFLAGAIHNLASRLQEMKQRLDAVGEYQRCLAILEEISRHPGRPADAEVMQAQVLINLALLQYQMGYAKEAEASYTRIVAILRPCVEQQPFDSDFPLNLAVAYLNWGMQLRQTGRKPEALAKCEEAVRLAEPVQRREPTMVKAIVTLRSALGERAMARKELGKYRESVEDYDRVIELAPAADRLAYRWDRICLMVEAQLPERTMTEARALAASNPLSAAQHYRLAQVFARLVFGGPPGPEAERNRLSREHSNAAVDHLKKARTAGYFDDPAHVTQFKTDLNLLPLKFNEEFLKLVVEIERGRK